MFAYRISAGVATVLLGLMAGFFFAFSIDVAPAMTHLNASAYTEAQQWINRVVRNAGFGGVYFGSVVSAFVPAILALRTSRRRLALAWAVVALVYGVAVFWVTRSINVPINDAVAQWSPLAPPQNWAALRDRWNEANLWRTMASTACFMVAVVLLSLPGRPAAH
ncbi:MAG: anthrone oxygenase family protein [Pseudomonadota bacterium]